MQRDVEAVSEYYAERHNIDRTDDWFTLKLNEEVGELTAGLSRSCGPVARQGTLGG